MRVVGKGMTNGTSQGALPHGKMASVIPLTFQRRAPTIKLLVQRSDREFSMSIRTVLLALAILVTACGEPPERKPVAGAPLGAADNNPIRDSIRARARTRFAERPDTLLARADLARTMGDSSAKLWVILTGQLQCPACDAAIRELVPMIRTEYAERGTVRLAFVAARAPDTDYNARFASHAVFCAGLAGKFWPMLEQIAATRATWAPLPDPQPHFDSMAIALGAQPARQHKCTERQLMLPLVMWDQERAVADVGTLPTLFVGSKALSGDLSASRVRREIDAALEAIKRAAVELRK